jgi:hypothetical protein
MSSSAPIIPLFGMPHSGTTWAGNIFDNHPDTLYRIAVGALDDTSHHIRSSHV